jgi:putative transcriptional regulator
MRQAHPALSFVSVRKHRVERVMISERIGITEQNVSLLKSGKVKGVRFDTLEKICEALQYQPGDILEYRNGADEIRALANG